MGFSGGVPFIGGSLENVWNQAIQVSRYPLTAKTTKAKTLQYLRDGGDQDGCKSAFLLGGDTVDGSEIRRENHLGCTKPCI